MPRIHWRPYGNNPTEPTWRRRGLNVITRLQALGVDIRQEHDLSKPCDAFVFQRYGTAQEAATLRARGTITILDINDCQLYDTYHNPNEARIAAAVDYVVTGSRHMVRRYLPLNPRTVLIQEALEDEFFTTSVAPPPAPPVVLSWHGMGDNLQYFEPIVPALANVGRKYDIIVRVIMPEQDSRGGSNVARVAAYPFRTQFVPWRLETFIQEIAAAHIGLAPLHDTEFCRNKGYHKAVGYMALGVSCVAADVAPYREIIEHGRTGMIAGTLGEWENSLTRLVKSKSLRARIAAAARPIAQHFTIDRVAGLWKDLFGMVLEG